MSRCALKHYVVFGLTAAVAVTAFAARPAARSKRKSAPAPRKKTVWQLTSSAYSFHDVTFAEAIDRTKDTPVKYIEGFAWQKISPKHPEPFNYAASPEALEAIKKKLDGNGLALVSYYVGDWGKDEAETRKIFEFCKKMGVQVLVGEPSADQFGPLDALAKEFKVKIAVHNHPRDAKNPAYTYWDPEKVMAAIKDYKNIGCCADTGHWVRSGLDPVACLKKYEGRLFSMHIKDVDQKGPEGKDVVWGKGVANVKGQLAEMQRQRFSGPIAMEYESNIGKNIPDLRACIEFYDKIVKELGRPAE